MGTGVNASKVVSYAVLAPKTGVNLSKTVAFAVLTPKTGVDVSKVCAYAVLSPPSAWLLSDSISFSDAASAVLGATNRSIVQVGTARAISGPTTVVTMPQNVTNGNFLVVMTGHTGGDECNAGAGNAVYTDTRGLTFTMRADAENVSGNQSNSCILTAPITSSGPETITRTKSSSNYPVSMFVVEIAGMPNFSVDSASGGTADTGTTVSSGNVTSLNQNLVLVGVGSDSHPSSLFDSALPGGSLVNFMSIEGAFLVKFVSNGTYSAVFNKSATGQRYSAAAALISTPFGFSVNDPILLSDSSNYTVGLGAFELDSFSLTDRMLFDIVYNLPPSLLHAFEFYGMEMPEDVEILPVPKKYDQVGPVRFDKIGKIFGFRVRMIASGTTQSMPYKIYGDDSESLDHLNSPLFADQFTVRPGLDNVYEIQLPKSVNTDICRITFGPVEDPFYRYDVLIKVHTSGMKGQAKWIPIR